MEIGVQLYSFREYVKTEDGVKKIASFLKDMNISHVQLSGFGKFNDTLVQWVKTHFIDNGIHVVSSHVDYHQLLEEFDYVVDCHKQLGISYLGIGALPPVYEKDKVSDYQTFVFELNNLARRLSDNDIQITYHNHSFEYVNHGPFVPMEIIMQNMDKEVVQLLPDLYWLQAAGVNPLTFIDDYHSLFTIVHGKDMKVKNDGEWGTKQLFAPIGDGHMGYREIIKKCIQKNIQYFIIEQDDFYEKDPFNEMKKSIVYTLDVLNSND